MPTPQGWSNTTTSSLSGVESVDSLISGQHWASGNIAFSFPTLNSTWSTDPDSGYGASSGEAEPWVDGYRSLADANRAAVRGALQAWADVADLNFTETADNATTAGDLRFAFASGAIVPDAQAWAYLPEQTARAGDVWFNADGSSGMEPWDGGSYEYLAVLHEIGHALGLKHPFESEPDNATLISQFLDARSYTVMSYSATQGNQDTYFSFEPTTPMLLDIAVAQHLYGVNTTHNSTNTIYTFHDGTTYHETIWDAGGNDTIVVDSIYGNVIDLRGGFNGSRVGEAVYLRSIYNPHSVETVSNLWIAFGVVIENATGGMGSDRITGNTAANSLAGGGGADTLAGGAGKDTLTGGAGDDTYIVTAGDVLYERSVAGTDTVNSPRSLALPDNFENLLLTGTGNSRGTGNALANFVEGNDAHNLLTMRVDLSREAQKQFARIPTRCPGEDHTRDR